MPPRSRRPAAETREHVLDVANELFYWHGIHATGIDVLAARAEVAPTTLYRVFGSKDGVITAYVERAAARYRQRWTAAALAAGPDPRDQILALFDELTDEVAPDNCRGCLFLLAGAEITDTEHPAHRAIVEIKTWTYTLLRDLAEQVTGADDDELGAELALLVDGVYGAVHVQRNQQPAHLARRLAERALGPRPAARGHAAMPATDRRVTPRAASSARPRGTRLGR